MLLEFACIAGGFLAGMTYAQERNWGQYRKTREEVKDEVSGEFDYYRNLSASLKKDLAWAKQQIETLKGKK